MIELSIAHTADLGKAALGAARALLDDVFGAEMTDEDWEHALGGMHATDEAAAFYVARGWTRWRGPSSALTPSGIERTPDDDGAIYVLAVRSPLDVSGELTCDWRDGDVW